MFFGLFSDSLVQSPTLEPIFREKWKLFVNGVYTDRQRAVLPRFYSEFRRDSHGSDDFVFEGIGLQKCKHEKKTLSRVQVGRLFRRFSDFFQVVLGVSPGHFLLMEKYSREVLEVF